MRDLKPYAEYRSSGLRWLGEIPAHWQVLRIKNVVRETDERNSDSEGVLLSLTRARGLLPQADATARPGGTEDLSKYRICRPGALVMNRMQAWSGMFAVSKVQGLVSPDYSVFRVSDIADTGYLEYLFRTPAYVQQFAQRSRGVGSGFNRLYTPDFGAISLALPPKREQECIAAFLAQADRRINRLTQAKRRVIDLLNEQKKAIIDRAVTRGIDLDAHLKPSGNAWLGDVPAHWAVGPLRRFWEVIDCKHLTVPFVDEGIPLASVTEVQSFDLDLALCKRTTGEWYQHLVSGGRKPKRGDLIYCRNTSVGACAFVNTDIHFAMGQDVCLIRSDAQNSRYLNYFLHSGPMTDQLERLLVGSTFKRINIGSIRALVVVVPPRSEQDSICRELDARLAETARAIRCVGRELDLLREYRARLVADVVTGKLDVQGVELRMLDESEDLDDFAAAADAEVDEMGSSEDARNGEE